MPAPGRSWRADHPSTACFLYSVCMQRVVRMFWSRWLSCQSKRPVPEPLGGSGAYSPRKCLYLDALKCCFLYSPGNFLSKITKNLKWIIRLITECGIKFNCKWHINTCYSFQEMFLFQSSDILKKTPSVKKY